MTENCLFFFFFLVAVGILYGITNVCVGHPFDTLKTKMQAQVGFEKANMFQTFAKTLRTQGVVGLYRYVSSVYHFNNMNIFL